MHRRINGVAVSVILLATCGCASHNVKYKAFIKHRIASVENAVAMEGSIDEAKELNAQAQLPHHTPREKWELSRKASDTLRAQIGSKDYILIGEVYGGGSARTNLETLKQALCKKAASHGGDVVFIFMSGIEQRAFAYSTPGYATTNIQGSAYGYRNYAFGNATANTVYHPGHTYAGTLHLPHANGLVFKHMPGWEAQRQKIAALDDAAFERYDRHRIEIEQNESLTFEQALTELDKAIVDAQKP